ncbi:MAG TPA: hypothetical protein VGP40_02710, partial [Chthoniobacterales bacterium]|nr:hypothetical protein [Chthoniobacterales bacterium]
MRHPKLLADLAQVAFDTALVVHDRTAADHFQIRDPGQVRQNFVLNAVGKEGIFLVFAQILKRQHRNAFLCVCGRFAAPRTKTVKDEQRHRESEDSDDKEVELSARSACDRFMWRDLFRSLDSFRRNLKRPGKDERERESENYHYDGCARDRVRQVQRRDHSGGDLHHDPANNGIRHRDFIDIAPLQLGKEVAPVHRSLVGLLRR